MVVKMVDFYKDKRVLITGHTGFKGSWLSKMLIALGAEVRGYALEPITTPNLYGILNLDKQLNSTIGDIRDLTSLKKVFVEFNPEVVFHLAAQPLVIESYENPVRTYETNVMGTVNVLECIRGSNSVKSFVNITTDKVYQNEEWDWSYREIDRLCGHDPYSNSKSCSELVTYSYNLSFFRDREVSISTTRAGNVIGGGDFSMNRIIPDCIRASVEGKSIQLRNTNSIRPYQHVLEPLFCYLMIAEKQWQDKDASGNYNIGPNESDCITTGELASVFCNYWEGAKWNATDYKGPHEANFLKLDCSKLKSKFTWRPLWDVNIAVKKTVSWTKSYYNGDDMNQVTDQQIEEFLLDKGEIIK